MLKQCTFCRRLQQLRPWMTTPDLLKLALEWHNWSVVKLGIAMHMRIQTFLEVAAGERPVTLKVAFRMEAVTHIPAGLWHSVARQREDWWRRARHKYKPLDSPQASA